MAKISTYSPSLSTMAFIKSKDMGIEEIRNRIKDFEKSDKALSVKLHKKGDFNVIEIIGPVRYEPDSKSTQIVGHMRAAYRENNSRIRDIFRSDTDDKNMEKDPLVFNLFTLGSNSNFFGKEASNNPDIHRAGAELGTELLMQATTGSRNIIRLNMLLDRKETKIIDEITNGHSKAMLYILGEEKQKERTLFPMDMILEMDLSEIDRRWSYQDIHLHLGDKKPYDGPGFGELENERRRHAFAIDLLSYKSSMMDVFLLQSRIHSIIMGDIADIKLKGSFLKEEMYELHNQMNNHMSSHTERFDRSSDKKKGSSGKKHLFKEEQNLFIRASQKFSFSSEVEHELMRCRSRLKYHLNSLMGVLKEMEPDPPIGERPHHHKTYQDNVISTIEEELEGLNEISSELSQSRSILYSNIDILRGFIEAEQRESSDRSSSLMNLLFLVFACIGLADATGNFVIFILQFGVLEGDHNFIDVVGYSLIALLITLIPLSIGAFFLYKAFRRG